MQTEQIVSQQAERIEELKAELRDLRKEYDELKRSEFRYRMIFDHSYVSIWEEDYREVYELLNGLKREGVSDIPAHLSQHPERIKEIAEKIKILDVNDATLRMYNATSKEAFLGSLDKIFVPDSADSFIQEMGALARGERYFEGETVGKKLSGEVMDLLLRITIPEKDGQGDYSNVLVSIIDISQRKKKERENLRLLRLSDSLRNTTLALTSTMDRNRILDIILDETKKTVEYTAVTVGLLEDGEIKLVRHRKEDGKIEDKPNLERIYNDHTSQICKNLKITKEPVLIHDTYEHPDWKRYADTSWVRSFLGIPIVVRENITGIISFCSHRPNMFTEESIGILEPYVHSAAVALENARLYAEAQREIREKKEAEEKIRRSLEEKKILLMEIHHRVKNNLNIVASLLNLHSDQITSIEQAREALQISQTRVHSMALVHENLYQSGDLAHIDIARYMNSMVEELVQLYATNTSVHFHLDIDKIFLDVTQAVPFGLLLNELITNALIHAFPDMQEGELNIQLSQEDSTNLVLSVRDNGIGIPLPIDFKNIGSLGLQLVGILAEQLHGNIEIENEGGTKVELSFPARDMQIENHD